MPHIVRDPETGQFVSVDDLDEDRDYGVFHGQLEYQIPAADLTAGVDSQNVEGEEATIIDMNNFLGPDEVFRAHSIDMMVGFTAGATATEEQNVETAYLLREDGALEGTQLDGTTTVAEGIIDAVQNSSFNSDVIFTGSMSSEANFADTTNGLGGGSGWPVNQHSINYPAAELPPPTFDEADELRVPGGLIVDGSDDQAQGVVFSVVARGFVVDT